jgi:flagellar hook-length control protein FliK
VPRVASETSALLPPLHNTGARHRTPGSGSGDAASPFALLLDSADAAPPKEPGRRAPESSSSRTTDQSPPNPSDPSNEGACQAQSDASHASTESQAADSTKSDAIDAESPEDIASADSLDSLMASAAANGPVPQSAPPAAIVNVSVEVVLVAQGTPESDGTAPAGTTAAPANPSAQLAEPGAALPAQQPMAENQAAASEQPAPPPGPGANEPVLAVDGTVEANDQPAATQASNDPASAETGKPTAEQTKPLNSAQPQPTDKPPDAPLPATGKHPTPPANSSPIEARKSEAANEVEDDAGGKPTDSTDDAAELAAADRPVRGRDRAHADTPAIDDKERQPLGAEIRDAAHSAKPPAEAVHAMLLANDQAAAAAVAQPASASGNENWEPAIPIAGLAVEIAARAQAGQSRFEIRLDPPELGRIDVRLDIDRSGQVTSRLIVDRPETLDQLRRDSAGLERALQDAGLKTAQNGLQFSLRDQGFAGRDYNSPSSDTARLVVPDPDLAPVEMPANAYGRMLRTGGIDIRV